MPWSCGSPCASRNVANVARRGSGRRASSLRAIAGTAAPDTRITPMPPRPAGVAIAAIVSRVTSSPGMGRSIAIEHALDLPLLEDGKDVVDQPVQHQPGGEEEKEDAEHVRHVLHDLRLHRVG